MLKVVDPQEIQAEVKKILDKQNFDSSPSQQRTVADILFDVKIKGDEALVNYTKKFDDPKFAIADIKVSQEKIDEAYKQVSKDYIASLRKAIANITAFHQKQKPDEWFETLPLDVVLGQRVIPIEKAGVYVPGGRAKYPSSVLMGVIPAKVAGVKEIYIASPPPVSPYVLVAAMEAGATAVFAVGGAQAIAALAYSTQTIPKVDKIVGPGNIYVTLAKKQVFGQVGIDGLAGPSNAVIIADQDAEPEFLAADLLSQAEHDPDSFALLLTDVPKVLEETKREIEKQAAKLKRKEIIDKACIYLMLVENIGQAIDITNQIAPEHLELQFGSPQRKLEKIKNAGAVFLGPHSPIPVGDYIAGPNHVLPTGGTARFASPLGVYDFVKTQSIVGYTKPALKEVWKDIVLLADVEGLDAHAAAIDVRFS